MGILTPGLTCWRTATAGRAAFLIDSQAYFSAAHAAMRSARRSILLLGWSFDPRTRLAPDGTESAADPDEIGRVLIALAAARPDLQVRVLIWRAALPVSASQDFFPQRAQGWFRHTGVEFHLDSSLPLGACHHQKVLVIDDRLAFCGGGDFCVDRWDTTGHLDADRRRILPDHDPHPARHEVMMMLDGPAASALGDLARERWRRATGRALAPCPSHPGDPDPWPSGVRPDLTGAQVAIARTEPAWRGRPGVHEIQAQHIAAIAAARRGLYIENQYLTSPEVAAALADRLREADGPDVVVVSTGASPSWFDRMTMDRTRAALIAALVQADRHGRLRVMSPVTQGGRAIIVHSKLMIVDDRIVRVGSANLNNRSGGFDTECELSVEADGPDQAQAIAALQGQLLGHFLCAASGDAAAAVARHGLCGAVDRLNAHGRLPALRPPAQGPLGSVVGRYHLGDPLGTGDAFRPLKRRRLLSAFRARLQG